MINVVITRQNLNHLRVSLFWSTSLQSNHVTQFLQYNNPKWKQAGENFKNLLKSNLPQHLPTSGEGTNSNAPMEDEGEAETNLLYSSTGWSKTKKHYNTNLKVTQKSFLATLTRTFTLKHQNIKNFIWLRRTSWPRLWKHYH